MMFWRDLSEKINRCCSEKKPEIYTPTSPKVTIHVWSLNRRHSICNCCDSLPHVAMEMDAKNPEQKPIYVSFGYEIKHNRNENKADVENYTDKTKLLGSRQVRWRTKLEDIKEFECNSNYVHEQVNLYSLNVQEMCDVYEELTRDDKIAFNLLGSICCCEKMCCSCKQNCSSVCHYLLVRGGIEKVSKLFSKKCLWNWFLLFIPIPVALPLAVEFVIDLCMDGSFDLDWLHNDYLLYGGVTLSGIGLLAALTILLGCGYCTCCACKGIVHLAHPRGLLNLAREAENGEKDKYKLISSVAQRAKLVPADEDLKVDIKNNGR